MKIHKEGFKSIIIAFLILSVLVIVLNFLWPFQSTIHYILYLLAFSTFLLTVRFFRVPNRQFINDENAIVCSADGEVVVIEKIVEKEHFNETRVQISVFMSPLNVHVNWYPISGQIQFAEHKDGRHYPAFMPKSSLLNEQSSIVIKHKNNKEILVRQIAGIMARRIVCFSKKDQQVEQGKELGIIKFGSRVDLLLPVDAKVNVKIGQKVKAGLDVIAYFKA